MGMTSLRRYKREQITKLEDVTPKKEVIEPKVKEEPKQEVKTEVKKTKGRKKVK